MVLRIERFNNRSVTEIQVKFTQDIDPDITINNVRVRSNLPNAEDLTVKSIRVVESVVSITTNQQSPLILYYVEFVDSDEISFRSVLGDRLPPGGNVYFFIGQERSNEIRDGIIDNQANVYNLDRDTNIRKHIANVSDVFLKGRTDIRETGNANFLSEEIRNEVKDRGYGPNDRLDKEGAYKVLRVSSTPEGAQENGTIEFNENKAVQLVGSSYVDFTNLGLVGFPSTDPLSLRSVEIKNEIVSNAEVERNKFDGLIITLSKNNIASINAVTLTQSDGTEWIYDIRTYGYTIRDNRYDTIHGRKLVTLESNQIRLSESAVISGDFAVPTGSDQLYVSYRYIDNGINVTSDTISVSQVRNATREGIAPLLTVFNLSNFPIVDSSDKIATYGGVNFLDPMPSVGNPFSVAHPAFTSEISFDANNLPSGPGEFSINYQTGQVYVYGASENDGTGNIPPVATYKYRKIFYDGIDFNYDSDADEIVVVPNRDLAGAEVKVSYEFERVLEEGVDYLNESHIEVIDEYVENRLANQTSFFPLKTPVTNAFRVFNETTGETYRVSRWTDNTIHFTGRRLPRIISKENEQVRFAQSTNETLYITEELNDTGSTKVIRSDLLYSNLISSSGQRGAANINSTAVLSNSDIYIREFFWDNILHTTAENLSKLSSIGDFIINYEDGDVYVLVDSDQDGDLGTISYSYGVVETVYSQVLGVNKLDYRKTLNSNTVIQLNSSSFTTDTITIEFLPSTVERFYHENTSKPILLGTVASGTAGQTTVNSYEFVAPDGLFSEDLADGYHILRIPGDPDRTILSVPSSYSLILDLPFYDTDRSVHWCVIDFNLSDGYQVATTYDPAYIKGIYTVTDLQTNDKDSLTNLYDPDLDVISGNLITLNNTAIQSISAGTALAIDYSYGTLYAAYNYVQDVLRASYEYGDNSLNFSVSDSLYPGDEYYVTYRYGALREKLLENFGALTQVEELTNFPYDFDRELYRDFMLGALQGFINGPTVPSIKKMVESVTKINPEINELTFNEWTIGRDNLHLKDPVVTGDTEYGPGKFDSGLLIKGDTTVEFPGESYISYRDGTFEAWITPEWNGIDNDATLTFDFGNVDLGDIYIGSSGWNPSEIPFNLNRADDEPYSPIGRPVNYPSIQGYYVWYDEDTLTWNLESSIDGYGEITTSGQIYNLRDQDGYLMTSTSNYIRHDGYGDGRTGAYDGYDGYEIIHAFTWCSDNSHYIFDTGPDLHHNRMSLFKDGYGYLNFRVYDDSGRRRTGDARIYSVSKNIQDWVSGEPNFVSCSWRLNTVEGIDELHLYANGQETSNLFKYGGKPVTTISSIYRTVADEILTASAVKPIVGGFDGQTISGSTTFTSLGSDFITDGINIGDELTILDATADGAGSPYTISGVGANSITISAPLLLTLDDVSFSINQSSFATETNIDLEKIAVFVVDGYAERTELRGLSAEQPDYSISRSGSVNTIYINNGVDAGNQIVINTLGLTHGRCREYAYVYEDIDGYSDGYVDTIRTRFPPPSELDHLDAYKVIFRGVSIESDGYQYGDIDGYDGYFYVSGSSATASFSNVCQPSNSVTGKKLTVTLGSFSNIDFGGTNEVVINGTTYGGPVTETVSFVSLGSLETSEYWTSITSIDMEFTALDPSISFGSISIIESIPFTKIENNGDYAQLLEYDNGVFRFLVYGSGGLPYEFETGCWYKFDYPVKLTIPMTQKGPLYIGSDINGENQLNGIVDQVVFLNEMLSDIRIGEPTGETRTVTEDYNSPLPLGVTPQTLMLLNLNKDPIENTAELYKTFDEGFITSSSSVNEDFGDAVIFRNDDALVIDNGAVIINNNSGTIEFWVSPIIDTAFDSNYNRYYVDMSTIRVEPVNSDTAISLTLPTRAKRIVSVRLINDDGTGTEFFEGGQLLKDGQTVVLGTRLPGSMTLVEVQYVPIDFNGDRVSIYKDVEGYLNFSIVADQSAYLIRYPISWKRNTWHRVFVTWNTNSIDGLDKMRMFVDGVEGGTLLWGTPGILYGSGVIYGQATVGTAGANALIADINLADTFGEVYIGNSYDRRGSAMSKMDNLRISNIAREPSLLGVYAIDINYNSNDDANVPVVEDNYTTLLLNFDKYLEETEFLTNLISKYTPLFTYDVNVDDGFRNLPDKRSRDLLISVLNRMKPAHARLFVKYLQELE